MQPDQESDSDQQDNERDKEVNVRNDGSGDLKKSDMTFGHCFPMPAFTLSWPHSPANHRMFVNVEADHPASGYVELAVG
jgi:hypothetical protein